MYSSSSDEHQPGREPASYFNSFSTSDENDAAPGSSNIRDINLEHLPKKLKVATLPTNSGTGSNGNSGKTSGNNNNKANSNSADDKNSGGDTNDEPSIGGFDNDIRKAMNDIPGISGHRILSSLSKYPGMISVICGAYVLYVQGDGITDSQEALAIIAIVCGAYTFFCWIYGQLNHHTIWADIKNHILAKIVQTVGIVILSVGDVCAALLVIQEMPHRSDTGDTTTTSSPAAVVTSSILLGNISNVRSLLADISINVTTAAPGPTTTLMPTEQWDNLLITSIIIMVSGALILLMALAQLFFGAKSFRHVSRICAQGQPSEPTMPAVRPYKKQAKFPTQRY